MAFQPHSHLCYWLTQWTGKVPPRLICHWCLLSGRDDSADNMPPLRVQIMANNGTQKYYSHVSHESTIAEFACLQRLGSKLELNIYKQQCSHLLHVWEWAGSKLYWLGLLTTQRLFRQLLTFSNSLPDTLLRSSELLITFIMIERLQNNLFSK